MNDKITELDKQRGQLDNRNGGWIIGRGAFSHGHDLMRDLLQNKTYFHVIVLNATGRLPEDRFCKWLEAIYICMSWPDPRIWCNTIGSLAGTARTSAMTATMAGLIASESKLYGTKTLIGGLEFIQACFNSVKDGESIEQAVLNNTPKAGRKKLHIPGYLRPIADGDDRVPIMRDYAGSLGYTEGEYLQLALKIESYLLDEYGQTMNVSGYISAFLSDQGFSPEDAYRLFATVVSSGVTACYVDDRSKPAGHFLPLRCDDVEYTGPASRSLPSYFTE